MRNRMLRLLVTGTHLWLLGPLALAGAVVAGATSDGGLGGAVLTGVWWLSGLTIGVAIHIHLTVGPIAARHLRELQDDEQEGRTDG